MKAIKKISLLLILVCLSTAATAQITEKPGFGKFAITNADIYTVTNGIIENGVVLIDDKKSPMWAKMQKSRMITPALMPRASGCIRALLIRVPGSAWLKLGPYR